MSTIRQKKLAHEIVENLKRVKPKNKQDLLISVGYAEKTADRRAAGVIASKGTQEELQKLGFSSDNAKRVVGEILNKELAEDKDRLKAAELIFKVNSDFAAEKHLNVNVQTTFKADGQVKEVLELANEELKRRKTNS